MSCDYQSVLALARCFECIPPGAQFGIQTKLMQDISGFTGDVNQLMSAARCIATCIPPGMLEEVKTNLLCEVVDNLEGGLPNPSVNTCVDADAAAFVTASGITDETQIYAICRLVTDLKTYPAVGTKYWSRDILIYPFVGGTALSHSINLKNPAVGTIIFGASVIHGPFGIEGPGDANTWANTVYLPAAPLTANDTRNFFYLDRDCTVNGKFYYGCRGTILNWNEMLRNTAASGPVSYRSNNVTAVAFDGTAISRLGAWIMQRIDANTNQIAYQGNALTNQGPNATTALPDWSFYLLATRDAGGVSANTQGNARISGYSLGTKLLSSAEWLEYRGIWETYQTRLGRNRP